MKETLIVAGFPAVGKTHLVSNTELDILDSDSSKFSWLSNGDGTLSRNPRFPDNYIAHIKENIGKVDAILVSTHKEVRDGLTKAGIEYSMVYPLMPNKLEYVSRVADRGSPAPFISMLIDNWEEWITELSTTANVMHFGLFAGQYLSDIWFAIEREAPRMSTIEEPREGDQPLPIKNEHTDIQSLVLADINHRRELGIQRYGTALQPENGRDMLRDAYEEALDLAIYLRGVIAERDMNKGGN